MKKLSIIILLLLPSFLLANKFDFYVEYGFPIPLQTFNDLPGVNECCPEFINLSGYNIQAGVGYNYSINELLTFRPSTGVLLLNNSFIIDEHIGNTLNQNLQTIPVISQHTLDLQTLNLSLDLLMNYKLNSFGIEFGLRNYFLLSNEISYKEELEDEDLNFTNGDNQFNAYEGELNDLDLFNSFVALGVHYSLDFNRLNLTPYSLFNYQLTNAIPEEKWDNTFVSVGLRFQLKDYVKPVVIEVVPKIITPIILTSLKAYSLKNGMKENVAEIVIEENFSKQIYPLLPYVFFDDNSFTVPSRYQSLNDSDIRNYNSSKKHLNAEILDVYYDLLNIVGDRLQRNPNSDLMIVGCNSNSGNEKDNTILSQERANKVKDYLVERWGIEPNRLSVNSRNLSENYSRGNSEEHNEENRRVELYSSNPEILKPLVVNDTLRTPSLPSVKFDYVSRSSIDSIPLEDWNIDISYESKPNQPIITFKGKGSVNDSLIWNVAPRKKDIPRVEEDLIAKLYSSLEDKDTLLIKRIKIVQKTISKKRAMKLEDDKEINDYRLIMFDHNSSNLKDNHLEIIKMICDDSNDDSEYSVTGFTDFMGSEAGNLKLSNNRAQTTKEALKCGKGVKSADGKGELEQKNVPNNLPEGRFYNRIVNIRAETPIEYK